MKCLSLLLALALLSSELRPSSASAPPSFISLINPFTQHLLSLLHKRDPAVRSLPPGYSPIASEGPERSGEAFRARRDEAPLSIDLTFHLLRNMIHMARLESQREQALLNRKVLDEVGK